jgi:hypothetical protein
MERVKKFTIDLSVVSKTIYYNAVPQPRTVG